MVRPRLITAHQAEAVSSRRQGNSSLAARYNRQHWMPATVWPGTRSTRSNELADQIAGATRGLLLVDLDQSGAVDTLDRHVIYIPSMVPHQRPSSVVPIACATCMGFGGSRREAG